MNKNFLLGIFVAIFCHANWSYAQDDLTFTAANSNQETGCISGNCASGFGTYVYKDGTQYRGDFKNNLADGKGICYYPNGDYYIGEWQKHNYNGKGTLYLKDGAKMAGTWENGDLIEKDMAFGAKPAIKNDPEAKVWAIVVGISKYQNYRSLRYTDDDAYIMYSFLKSPEGGALPEDQITLLIDDQATKANIESSLSKILAQADTNDTFLMYYSGHGVRGAFLPTDYNGNPNSKLSYQTFLNYVKQCQAKRKIIISDVCNAGSIQENLIASKSEVNNLLEVYKNAMSDAGSGTVLMLSSSADEQSIENGGVRQGVFSYYLIQGLNGAANKNNDNIITIQEVFNYTNDKVQQYTNFLQNPMVIGDFDPNIPIGIIRGK